MTAAVDFTPDLSALSGGLTPPAVRLDEQRWIARLIRAHQAERFELDELLSYYNGQQRLSYMHPALLEKVDSRVRQVIVNWPRTVIDALEERIDIEGFRLDGRDIRNKPLWRIWQYNDLDEGYQQAHVTAMVMRRAFAIVGTNPVESQYPLVTIESPQEVYAELDPATRQVRAAIKRWSDDLTPTGEISQYVTLYLPNRTVTYTIGPGGWWEVDRDEHNLGVVPVVPIVNRPQMWAPLGTSELSDVIPISDAACKIATDMMVSAEFHAMPRRYALGFDEDDFTDSDGNPLTPWQAVAGVLWSSDKNPRDDGVSVGQFQEADLTNFHNTLRSLATLVSTVSGLPLHDLGYSSDNPASADGIRAAENRHVKRAERRRKGYERAWEQVMRLVLLVRDGELPDNARWLETIWADAATPTFSQKSDAVVKLYSADQLVPRRMSRRKLGFTVGEIADMEAEDRESQTRIMADPAASFGPKPDGSGEPEPGEPGLALPEQPDGQQA